MYMDKHGICMGNLQEAVGLMTSHLFCGHTIFFKTVHRPVSFCHLANMLVDS